MHHTHKPDFIRSSFAASLGDFPVLRTLSIVEISSGKIKPHLLPPVQLHSSEKEAYLREICLPALSCEILKKSKFWITNVIEPGIILPVLFQRYHSLPYRSCSSPALTASSRENY